MSRTQETTVREILLRAISEHGKEVDAVRFLPELRYDRSVFRSGGQYDWFSGQLVFCLIRNLRPSQVVEISCSSGYSSLFIATALARNQAGVLHTFELSPANASSALKNFHRFGVNQVINLHLGDVRKTIREIDIQGTDLLFIDSLHTADFARWYLEELVARIRPETLVHVHDIMPVDARVRLGNGPPFPGGHVVGRIKHIAHSLLGMHKDEYVRISSESIKPPVAPGELPSYDGNHFTEAVYINEILKLIAVNNFLYLHQFSREQCHLDAGTYDQLAVQRKDSFGKPFEWNVSVWLFAGALGQAYSQLKG